MCDLAFYRWPRRRLRERGVILLKLNYQDLVGGALIVLLGVYVLITALGFGIGTARRMDAGFYPMLLGIAAILLGVGIISLGLCEPGSRTDIAWKPFLAIITGLVIFFLLLERAGLIPAVWALVGISAIAEDDLTWKSTLLLMLIVSVAVWLLFTVVLRLPLNGIVGLF